jgi:hypothetical protein
MILEFTVPLPPRDLSPNRTRNTHWSRKSSAVSDYRQLVAIHARNATPSAWETPATARVSLIFGLKNTDQGDRACYHPKDADNALASFKAGIDGMVDSGLLESDRWENLEIGLVRASKVSPAGVYVTLEVLAQSG